MVSVMDDALYPSQKADRIMVRLPDGLRDRLNALAKANGRSANAEVVMALEHWLAPEGRATVPGVLNGEEQNALGTLLWDAIRSAAEKDPNAPGLEAFRKAIASTGEVGRIDVEGDRK